MITSIGLEPLYKNGDRCPMSGLFRFSGYQDGTQNLLGEDEKLLYLKKGETFPRLLPAAKDCWWRMV